MGSAAVIQNTIRELERRDPESLRQMLWSDDWLALGLQAFRTRLENAERDAVRMYLEAIGTLGPQGDRTIVMLLGSIGVSDAEEARRLVEVARSAEQADVAQLQQQWLSFGRTLMRDPRFRETAREVLFGELSALPEASSAEVVGDLPGSTMNGHANGHANGNGRAHS